MKLFVNISLLIFSVISLFAQPKNSCHSYYRDAAEIIRSYIFIANEKYSSETRWLSNPYSEPLLNNLVIRVSSFSEAERFRVQDVLHSSNIKDKKLKNILLLSSYDKQTWISFIENAMSRPLSDDSLVNSLIPLVRKMPWSLKMELVEFVKPKYSKLSKKNFTLIPFRTNLRLAPKRAIDALFLHLFPAAEWFEQDLEVTQNMIETYDRYLRYLKQNLFDKVSNGGYSTDEVLTVARAIQKVIIKKMASSEASVDTAIWITGSFPNGRAKLNKTDLDAQLTDRKMIQWFPEINEQINSDVKKFKYKSKYEVEAMWETTTPHFAAQINPIFLKITPTSISLDIYPEIQPYYKDKVLIPENYKKPKSFVLETRDLKEEVIVKEKSSLLGANSASPTFLEAMKTQLQDYDKKTNWMNYPSSDSKVENLVQLSLSLNENQRKAAIEYLNKLGSKNNHLEMILKLSLFDRAAWDKYFDDFSTKPQGNDALYNSLVPVIRVMPVDLRDHLLSRIAEIYPRVKREKWVREGLFFRKVYKTIAPKRALDILVNQLLPAHKEIEENLRAGSDIMRAYNSFIQKQREVVYKGSEIGNYSADLVFVVAKKIQEELKKFPKKAYSEELILAGSFPNGRAQLKKSDIDIQIPNVYYEDLIKNLHEPINKILYTFNGKEGTEVNSMFLTTTRINAAIVSPVQIKITRDEIRLEVYRPIKNIDRDEVQLPENYEAPFSMPLTFLFKLNSDKSNLDHGLWIAYKYSHCFTQNYKEAA